MTKVQTAQEAAQNDAYKKTLVELIYQLADDDFIIAFRGSEWLGLAPHIEEDVAYSSINQNTMGHAAMLYQLLEDLGEGDADELAHGRKANERKNAIILEEVNGPGTYLVEPKYDWAFTVVRHYFYDLYKKIKLESLKNSSYEPLAQVAININKEEYYHLMHWGTWFKQLSLAGGEATEKMKAAVEKVWADLEGLITFGPNADKMEEFGLIAGEEELRKQYLSKLESILQSVNFSYPGEPGMKRGNGRIGEHTKDLDQALETLSEVYVSIPKATW